MKNILCVLSLSDTDRHTIKYTAHLARISGTENIYVNFINEYHNLPDYLKDIYPSQTAHENQAVINKLREDILTVYISDMNAEVHFNVFEKGSTIDSCLKFILNNEIDLVLYKKNTGNRDSISFAKKLARRATCTTLLLTENYTSYNKLLVPTDFSAHSKEAIEWAIQFAQLASIPYISLLHIIETSFRDTLKSYEPKKYIGLIKENATNELNNILNTINTKDIKIDRILEINDTIESGIQQTCREKKIDLIVIAARGTSSGISIFLGSVADKLVEISNIPILVVKKKGTGTSVLETLFKMF